MMTKNSLQVLEYYRLLEIISNYTKSPLGKNYILSLTPVSDPIEIESRLKLLSEIREFLNVKGNISVIEISPLDKLLNKTKTKGIYLTPEEIFSIKRLLGNALEIRKFILSEGREYKRLCQLVRSIPDLKDLFSLLDKSISDTGNIKDSASPKLKKIRERKALYRSRLQKRLEEILAKKGISDFHISIRDGRFVVGINSSNRSNLKGIFHGYSQSKATSFIEPVEIVDENNRMAELESEEKEEERKILVSLTEKIAEKRDEIKDAQNIIAKIDALCAQARFCDLISCIMPEICDEDLIEIKGARNPLLTYLSKEGISECVPIDLILDKKKRILIISGPNRGGKTVSLKTLGLLILMAQTGIHIPAEEGSRFRAFKKIMAEIGDEQDLQSGMSTFSAHVLHLKEIIEEADKDSLIIIDEPGMGTDPIEGAALSMAILDTLIERGSFVAISTHLNRIKLYGLGNPNVMSASVEFDLEKRTPTYRLKYGSPGVSMGFEIAKQIGIPEDILKKAKEYVSENEYELSRSIEILNRLIKDIEKDREEFIRLKEKYTKMYEDLNRQKKELIESAKKEVASIISDAKKEALRILDSIKEESNVSAKQILSRVSNITQDISSKLRTDTEDTSQPQNQLREIKEGQIAYHRGLKSKVVVSSYNPDKNKVLISLGNIRLWTDLNSLEPIIMEEEQESEILEKDESETYEGTYMPEINVVGCRVEDAIRIISKAIDDALLKGSPGVRIIHGVGTGRLRKAIREYLKNIPQVKEIRGEDNIYGADAITIVEFK